jgi:hypothetical protein
MTEIEQFFAAYQNTFLALGAIGTFTAVIVSLWLALRADKTKIEASIAVEAIFHDTIDPNNRPRFMTVHLINQGRLPVRIPFSLFRWKLPFTKTAFIVNPLDAYAGHQWAPHMQYPVIIEPKAAHTVWLTDIEAFRQEMAGVVQHLNPIRRVLFRFLGAVVYTQDTTLCKVRITRSVRAEIVKLLD